MSAVPPPGTKAARDAGCRCTRVGWEWDPGFMCELHLPPIPSGPGICEHGEREWTCTECADRAQMNVAYESDLRGLRHQKENDFGAQP